MADLTPSELLLSVADDLDAHPERYSASVKQRGLLELFIGRADFVTACLAWQELEDTARLDIPSSRKAPSWNGPSWNDKVARDAAEVAILCRRAAERLKEGE